MSDETKPWDGRPENPDRDAMHWLCHHEDLRPVPMPWNAEYAVWCSGGMHSPQGVIDLGWRYLGPCPLPEEHAALLAERDALRAERDEARLLAGLGCDANGGGEHSVITQGTYRFCHKCGHTITQPDLRDRCRKAEAERDALRAALAAAPRAGTGDGA